MVETEEKKHEFPCQACGANLIFAPGTEQLRCEYCGAEQKLGTEGDKAIVEYDFAKALSQARRRPATELVASGKQVRCNSCGAVTIVDAEAGRCAFCDSPVVLVQQVDELFVPESLLPFGIGKEQARDAYRTWVRSLWFAPNNISHRAQQKGMDGVYLPYWTYDSKTTTPYTGMRGTHYYVTESYTDSDGKRQTRRVQKTRWTPAFGTVRVGFDDVLVPATRALPRGLLDRLEPWDLPALVPYEPGYLSGFLANRYDIELEAGFDLAEDRMEVVIASAIRRDIGGDEQQILSMNVKHADVTFKHLLLPLWISSYRYGEKVFRFVVNARTGEVAGERPYSWIKISLAVLAGLAVLAVILYFSRGR